MEKSLKNDRKNYLVWFAERKYQDFVEEIESVAYGFENSRIRLSGKYKEIRNDDRNGFIVVSADGTEKELWRFSFDELYDIVRSIKE